MNKCCEIDIAISILCVRARLLRTVKMWFDLLAVMEQGNTWTHDFFQQKCNQSAMHIWLYNFMSEILIQWEELLIFYDHSSAADLNILHILLCLCISHYFSIPLWFDYNFLFSEMKDLEKLIFSIILSAWNHTTRHYLIHTFECLAWLSTPQCGISWDLFNSLKLFKTLANNARADIYLDKSTECFHIYSPQGNRQQFRPPLWTTRKKMR